MILLYIKEVEQSKSWSKFFDQLWKRSLHDLYMVKFVKNGNLINFDIFNGWSVDIKKTSIDWF